MGYDALAARYATRKEGLERFATERREAHKRVSAPVFTDHRHHRD
jgi:hypothetical protein